MHKAVDIVSKLGPSQLSIFAEMSALANKHNAINLGQGFPDYNPPNELLELVKKFVDSNHHQYAPVSGVGALREAIAQKTMLSCGYFPDPDTEITITAGATQAIFTAIQAFVHAGDEVILFEPAYDSYGPSIKVAGGKAIACTMEYHDGKERQGGYYRINWSTVKGMLTPKTRMIIINSPHNPTGKVFDLEDLAQLEKLVEHTNIIVLSDEVYEHLIFDKKEHQSVWRYSALRKRSISVHSFGKTFHATGWKLGYAVASPLIMEEFRKLHQWNVFSVNTFVQHAIAEYLKDSKHYNYLNSFYQSKRDLFRKLLSDSAFRLLPCEGTYFQLADFSVISDMDDVGFAKWLTAEIGVTAIPVSVFSAQSTGSKLIRFCFAKSEQLLEAAAEKLLKL